MDEQRVVIFPSIIKYHFDTVPITTHHPIIEIMKFFVYARAYIYIYILLYICIFLYI